MPPLLFARVGWMKWYRGPQPGDEKPIGGGSYNKREIGHEAYNFLPLDGYTLGYFQPRLHTGHSSSIALECIDPASGEEKKLNGVLAVFVATDPENGGQPAGSGTPLCIAMSKRRTTSGGIHFPTI